MDLKKKFHDVLDKLNRGEITEEVAVNLMFISCNQVNFVEINLYQELRKIEDSYIELIADEMHLMAQKIPGYCATKKQLESADNHRKAMEAIKSKILKVKR